MTDRTPQMAHAGPWQAVIVELTGPAAELPTRAIPPRDSRPTPGISRGHPFSARGDSIRCLKQRAITRRRLYAITFDSDQPFPAQWRRLIAAEQEDDGWVARGGAGGAGDAVDRVSR